MSEPAVLFKIGDPWRDLLPEIHAMDEPVTLVTRTGSTYVIYGAPAPGQLRIPAIERARSIVGDHEVRRLEPEVVTPCGVVSVWHHGAFAESTEIALVLVGEVLNWHETIVGQALIEHLRREQIWNLDGHPDQACGALHCRFSRA